MAMTKHIYDMTQEELAQVVCSSCGTNTMDEYGCRNSMKDNEAFCSECCADEKDGTGISCCG
jgi:hypothetical protein